MKLIGNLKNQVEKANSKEEAKGIIEKAGMQLTADELEMVTGGSSIAPAERSSGGGRLPSGDPGPSFQALSDQEKEKVRQSFIGY